MPGLYRKISDECGSVIGYFFSREEIAEVVSADKLSESESENSQRSSTDRDFEMVEPGDLEGDTPPREHAPHV